jgi:hypothetical protein
MIPKQRPAYIIYEDEIDGFADGTLYFSKIRDVIRSRPALDTLKTLENLLRKWKALMKTDTWLTEMNAIPLDDIEADINDLRRTQEKEP